jgi:predicted membrane protein
MDTIGIIIKYGIIAPLYTVFWYIIPILLIIAVPIFISGIIIALFGTLGHILFITLFAIALLYYVKYLFKIFYPKKKRKIKTKTLQKKKGTKFSTSLNSSTRIKNYTNRYRNYTNRYGNYRNKLS